MSMLQDYTRHNQRTVLAVIQDAYSAIRLADLLIIFDEAGIAAMLNHRQADFIARAEEILEQMQPAAGRTAEIAGSQSADHPAETTGGDISQNDSAGIF